MNIGNNIKYLRIKCGLSQEDLSIALGYKSYTTITKWESNVSEPTLKMAHQIADFFKISVNELCYADLENPIPTTSKGVKIPVLGKVAAGVPIHAVEEIIDYEEITESLSKTGEFFGLQIKGDSMEPKFSDGDVVIVKKQEDAENGNIVIATINGDDATCKRLMKYQEGIALVSNNPVYSPLHFTNKEIEDIPVKILGRVIELRAKF